MKSKFLRITLAAAVTFAMSALAQTGSAATPSGGAASALPSAPSASSGTNTPVSIGNGTKVGAINIEGAIFGSNEGRKEIEALQKKFEPKQAELKSQNEELEALKKQLTTQEGKLSDDAAANLKKQIETKQKTFDRSMQDAQEDFGNQQQEIAGKILQKMAPLVVKYAQDNGFGMIIDTSKPWPQGPVLIAGGSLDITQAVVEAYNAQSGVATPSAPGGQARPSAPKPTTGATKPPASNSGNTPK